MKIAIVFYVVWLLFLVGSWAFCILKNDKIISIRSRGYGGKFDGGFDDYFVFYKANLKVRIDSFVAITLASIVPALVWFFEK